MSNEHKNNEEKMSPIEFRKMLEEVVRVYNPYCFVSVRKIRDFYAAEISFDSKTEISYLMQSELIVALQCVNVSDFTIAPEFDFDGSFSTLKISFQVLGKYINEP